MTAPISDGFHASALGPLQLRALLRNVASMASGLELPGVRAQLVDAAADLADARYASIGLLDADRSRFVEVLTVGMSEAVHSPAAAAALARDAIPARAVASELAVRAERERIASELHDTVLQRLFATGLSMHTTIGMIHDSELRARVQEHIDEIDATIREVRAAVFALETVRVDGPDLRAEVMAATAHASRFLGFEPTLLLHGALETVEPTVAAHTVAVLRESLINVARHAGASHVEVAVALDDGRLRVEVRDDGDGGFERSLAGNGLRNIRRRAQQLGGHARVERRDGGGTVVEWIVPAS